VCANKDIIPSQAKYIDRSGLQFLRKRHGRNQGGNGQHQDLAADLAVYQVGHVHIHIQSWFSILLGLRPSVSYPFTRKCTTIPAT
jgi:hypothetical protein